MKRHLLSAIVLFLALGAAAQNNLSSAIRGPKGVSNHFVTLAKDQNISFNGNDVKNILGLAANANLVLTRTETDKLGFVHYRYYQTYKGIPVENSMYTIHTRNQLIKGLSGSIVTEFDPLMDKRSSARINNTAAIQNTLKKVGAQTYAWQDEGMQDRIKMQTGNKNASYAPVASLVWFNPGETLQPRELRLCYKVDVYAIKPLSRADYFVDAITGEVIGKQDKIYFSDATGTAATYWSSTQTIHSDFTGTAYRLRDYSRGGGVITLHGDAGKRGTDYTSASANWSLAGADIAALDAHFGVEQTYSYYMTNFGRNSYDGLGTALYSYVNDPTYIDNAFWDGSSMNYNKRSTGEAGGVTGIDVTGHELTHGVTQSSCNLVYSYESGAINESLSDIMGKSVQFWAKPTDINWQLSNDMNWIIRDMSNPNLISQPDTYKGTFWYSGFGDNGGVHYNSGVGNFMFYLLVNGGTGTNDIGNSYNVGALGLAVADQIIYRSQTVYLVANSQYADWRTACINAASDLYGPTSNEVAQVKNAFYAVGIGSSANGCDAPGTLVATGITQHTATLNWNAVAGVSTYNLQYKLTTGSVWTTVSNIATTSYNLTGLGAGLSYDFKVESNCPSGTGSGYSSAVSFSTLSVGGYCTSAGLSTAYEYIDRVAVGTVGYTSGNNNGYANLTNIVGQLKAGRTYKLSLTPGFVAGAYSENWAVYIDFNRNGSLADAGELVGTVTTASTAPATVTFTVPLTAKNGRGLLRVQMFYGILNTDPCATFDYGETEDYSVNITGGTAFAEIAAVATTPANTGNTVVNIMPNPVKGTAVTVNMDVQQKGAITLKVTDLSGRLLLSQKMSNAVQGKNTFTLNGIEKLTRGVFMVIAEQNNTIIGRTQLIKD
jgi:Zn-dependent metalloprotease